MHTIDLDDLGLAAQGEVGHSGLCLLEKADSLSSQLSLLHQRRQPHTYARQTFKQSADTDRHLWKGAGRAKL